MLDWMTTLPGPSRGRMRLSTPCTAGGSATTICTASAAAATASGVSFHWGMAGCGVRFQQPASTPAAA